MEAAVQLRTLLMLCVVCAASTACASTAAQSSPTRATTTGSNSTRATDAEQTAARATAGQSRIVAGSSGATLDAAREPLLKVPGVGTLFASCTTQAGRLTTSFVTSPRLPSNTNIIVAMHPGGVVR